MQQGTAVARVLNAAGTALTAAVAEVHYSRYKTTCQLVAAGRKANQTKGHTTIVMSTPLT
jgi:hypothetical protein